MSAASEMTGAYGRRRHFKDGEAAWLISFVAECSLPFQWRVRIDRFDVVVPMPATKAEARRLLALHGMKPAGTG